MKRLLLLLCFSPILTIAQISQNISLYANWIDSSVVAEPNFALKYNSVWGYAQGGKEYAIIGSTKGTHIVDVTNPSSPVQVDYVAGRRSNCIWREYKTYNNYLYMVSDDGGSPANSMQIMDLSYLPDSVHVVYDSNALIERAHTLFIDGNRLYLAVPKGGTAGTGISMAVYSLANPESPTLLRRLNQDYSAISVVHDMYVRNDTVFASAANQGLHIYKFTAQNTFQEIASFTAYPSSGYNHSSALTDNGRILVFADEVPAGLDLKAIEVSDLSNISLLDLFNSGSTATPHNPFIRKGDNTHVTVAYYADGVQIFNLSNPANITRTGFYDTDPLNNGGNSNYQGCWGAYVDLPSGVLLASDMQNGLFILDATVALGLKVDAEQSTKMVAYPVPFTDVLHVSFEGKSNKEASLQLYDMSGKLLLEEIKQNHKGLNHFTINTKVLPAGMYVTKVFDGENENVKKVVKY
jgi:choice-of-anchor B domain-containing protein